MHQSLRIGPIVILHDRGVPFAVDGSDEVDGLPPDVAEELLACASVAARCEADADENPCAVDGLNDDGYDDGDDPSDYPED